MRASRGQFASLMGRGLSVLFHTLGAWRCLDEGKATDGPLPFLCKTIMKKIFTILALIYTCTAVKAQTLYRGAVVPVKITSTIDSRNPESVSAMVNADVKSPEGDVVIRYGAPVEVNVEAQRARGCGRPGTLDIKFIATQAVNGQMVPLEGGSIYKEGKSKKGLAIGLGVGLGVGLFTPPLLAIMALKGEQAIISEGTTSNSVRTATDIIIK